MSAKFCLLIPSKVLQIDKYFSEKLQFWMLKTLDNYNLSSFSLCSLSDFQKRPDVHLDLPDDFYNRYYVIDWGFYFPSQSQLRSFLDWLAEIYLYGEVGLLKHWSDKKRHFPPIKIGETNKNLAYLSISDLPLDELFWLSLQSKNR